VRKKGALFVIVLLVLGLFGSVVGCAVPVPTTSSTPPLATSSVPPPTTSSTLPPTGWVQLSLGKDLGKETFYALAIDPTNPQVLYAGTDGDGVFKTTDGGASWSAASSGLTYFYILSLAIDPTNPQVLYAGTDGCGVFKTTDGGSSWSEASSGLANSNVLSLAIDPSNPQLLYAGTDGGVFKTTNGGGD
jgi:photosystem II stability/assembly factor-like uncharacterized protein